MTPVSVLLASDDPHRTIYTMLLQEAGFRVVETGIASEIVPIAQKEKAEAVIVDLQKGAAVDAPGEMRLRAELGDGVPVVVLSESAALQINPKRKLATLPKPCHPRDVLRALNALLGRSDRAARRARAALGELGQANGPDPNGPGELASGGTPWNGEEMRRLWEGLRPD